MKNIVSMIFQEPVKLCLNSCTKQYAISKTTFIATRKSWSCVLCNRSEVHTYKLYIYLLKNLTIKDKCSEMDTMQSVF